MTGMNLRGAAMTVFTTAVLVLMGCLWSGGNVAGQTATTDRASLSRQAFVELAVVLKHPRCLNCHTSVDYPRQGDDQRRHAFNVKRGSHDRGAASMQCQTCHQAANQDTSGVPGAQGWRLAPLRMAWDDLSPGQLCRALLDPARGGMTPTTLIEHLDSEKLVAWAWQPGRNSLGTERRPPSISHDEFNALARNWAELGSVCPD